MAREITLGMWVVDEQDRVGIAQKDSIGASTVQTLHYIEPDGTTRAVVARSWVGLRQAPLAAIPEPRRPDAAMAARLQYV